MSNVGYAMSWVNSKDMALPLFLTTRLVRKAAYPKVREFLHSHRKAETWWDATDSDKLPCCWSFYDFIGTHDVDPQQLLAVNLADLTLPKFLAVFSNVNANSTYYLSKTPFPERVQTKFQQWLRHHALPPGLWTSFQQFMHDRYLSGGFSERTYGFVFLKRKKQWAKGRTLTVQSSLSSHTFSALGCIWRQIRGAGIGSQISPSLLNLLNFRQYASWVCS